MDNIHDILPKKIHNWAHTVSVYEGGARAYTVEFTPILELYSTQRATQQSVLPNVPEELVKMEQKFSLKLYFKALALVVSFS